MESIPRHNDHSHFSPGATFRRCVSWSDTARDARGQVLRCSTIWHRELSVAVFTRDKSPDHCSWSFRDASRQKEEILFAVSPRGDTQRARDPFQRCDAILCWRKTQLRLLTPTSSLISVLFATNIRASRRGQIGHEAPFTWEYRQVNLFTVDSSQMFPLAVREHLEVSVKAISDRLPTLYFLMILFKIIMLIFLCAQLPNLNVLFLS